MRKNIINSIMIISLGLTLVGCGGDGGSSPSPSPSPSPDRGHHIIFVTAARIGSGGGFDAANRACNTDVNKPSTFESATFKALLAGNNATTPGTSYYQAYSIKESDGGYLIGESLIAVATSGNLIAGEDGSTPTQNLVNPITIAYLSANVWTGTSGSNCNNWTSIESSLTVQTGGQAGYYPFAESGVITPKWWNQDFLVGCDTTQLLDCVSQ